MKQFFLFFLLFILMPLLSSGQDTLFVYYQKDTVINITFVIPTVNQKNDYLASIEKIYEIEGNGILFYNIFIIRNRLQTIEFLRRQIE